MHRYQHRAALKSIEIQAGGYCLRQAPARGVAEAVG